MILSVQLGDVLYIDASLIRTTLVFLLILIDHTITHLSGYFTKTWTFGQLLTFLYGVLGADVM